MKKIVLIMLIIIFFVTGAGTATISAGKPNTAYTVGSAAAAANSAVESAGKSENTAESGSTKVTAGKSEIVADYLGLKAKSVILMDGDTGTVLYEINSSERRQIASLTKIMSMYLIFDAIDSGKLNYNDMVQVSEHSYDMGGSQVWLEPGEEFTVDEMLKAIVIHSANDATVAMAEKIAGSEEAFVVKMNETAQALGMKDTYYKDSTGLTDEGHYSSARDIALLTRILIGKHPSVVKYSTIWLDKFRDKTPGKEAVILRNTNELIHTYSGAIGLKTGFTTLAGYCLSAAATRDKLTLVSVVMGAPDIKTRFVDSKKLLDYGYANYERVSLQKKGSEAGNAVVAKGVEDKVQAIYSKNITFILEKGGKNKLKEVIQLEKNLEAPVTKGSILGKAVYYLEGKKLGSIDLLAGKNVDRASFFKILWRMIMKWLGL